MYTNSCLVKKNKKIKTSLPSMTTKDDGNKRLTHCDLLLLWLILDLVWNMLMSIWKEWIHVRERGGGISF